MKNLEQKFIEEFGELLTTIKTDDGSAIVPCTSQVIKWWEKKIEELLKIQEQNHKVKIQKILHAFEFLLKYNYLADTDAICEEPKTVDSFLNLN